MRAQDLASFNHPPNICLVGEAGCGKTALSSQVGDNAFIFDFDDGMRTALTLKDQFTKARQSTPFETYLDTKPLQPNAYIKAKQKLNELLQAPKPPRAVVLDSLTSLAISLKLFVMNTTKRDPFATPEIQHWGTMINEVEGFIMRLRALNCLTIMTAHTGFAEEPGGAVVHIINSITKNHGRNKIANLFDEVLYMCYRPLGQGKHAYITNGRVVGLPCRTRSGLTSDVNVAEIGLKGLLEKVGFSYDPQIYQPS